MKQTVFRTGVLACLFCLTAPLTATSQISPSVPSAEPAAPDDNQELWAALQRRAKLAGDVATGKETPDDALTQLRSLDLPARFSGDKDADFAHAAIDVGQRLDAADKKDEARKFFQAADESLSGVIERTADSDVASKVQAFSNRAFIRAQFLTRIPEAIADLDAALKLKPDDAYLADLRRLLLSDKAAWVTDKTPVK